MAKTAWLIITDLHLYHKNISSHIDYVSEMIDVRAKIIRIAKKYTADGFEKVNLLLLGDVFHRSYSKPNVAIDDNNFFVMWNERFGEVYSVIGNHELSYYKSNPFFSMVNKIESEKLKGVKNKVWTPIGLLPVIKVVDELVVGNLKIFFNHSACPVTLPEDDGFTHIGLFHLDIVCEEIRQIMENKLGGNVFAETTDFSSTKVFDGYDYCFFGHMHKVYGTWKTENGTILCYLASLGRTNVTEINDNFLERNVPAIKIVDDKFCGIDDNFIELPSVGETVNVAQVLQNQVNSELSAKKKQARGYEPLSDDPIESLKTYYVNDKYASTIVDELLTNPIDSIGINLRAQFKRRFGE